LAEIPSTFDAFIKSNTTINRPAKKALFFRAQSDFCSAAAALA
jgi:hypothetical protein